MKDVEATWISKTSSRPEVYVAQPGTPRLVYIRMPKITPKTIESNSTQETLTITIRVATTSVKRRNTCKPVHDQGHNFHVGLAAQTTATIGGKPDMPELRLKDRASVMVR